jgi:excinuclease ABC subunit B
MLAAGDGGASPAAAARAVELAVADDPLARQSAVEEQAGKAASSKPGYAPGGGRRPANPLSRPHKPSLDEMGPHAERPLPSAARAAAAGLAPPSPAASIGLGDPARKIVKPGRIIDVADESDRPARPRKGRRTGKTGRPGR